MIPNTHVSAQLRQVADQLVKLTYSDMVLLTRKLNSDMRGDPPPETELAALLLKVARDILDMPCEVCKPDAPKFDGEKSVQDIVMKKLDLAKNGLSVKYNQHPGITDTTPLARCLDDSLKGKNNNASE